MSLSPFLWNETCDVVFHLAATVGIEPSISNPTRVYANNVSSTAIALEIAKMCGAKRFVFASSSTVYGDMVRETGKPVNESTPFNPLNTYAASKIVGESMVRDISQFAGIDYTILRLFSVYGPGMKYNLAMPKIAKCAYDGTTFTMRGDGSASRDYVYVDDVVDAFVLAATKPKAKDMVFNVCCGNPVSLRDTISAVERAMGARVHIKQCNEMPYDAVATFGDNSLASDLLSWKPKVGFDEGVKRFSEWFKNKESQ